MIRTISPEEQETRFLDDEHFTTEGAEGDAEANEEVETNEDVEDELEALAANSEAEGDDAEAAASEGLALHAMRDLSKDKDGEIEAAKSVTASSVKPSMYVPPISTPDPVTKEPYRWNDCTINISIQLLPNKSETERDCIIGIRTHLDAPIIKRIKADCLEPLPACIADLIAEMREELPIRAAAYLERERKHAGKHKKDEPVKKARLKPGRHLAANLFAAKSNETVDASEASKAEDDDLFAETFDAESPLAKGDDEIKAAVRAAITSPAGSKKKGKLKPAVTPASSQGSLLG